MAILEMLMRHPRLAKAKQIIATSTVDTSGVGGDDSLPHLTSFARSR
jgi:hypothetical protein